MVQDSRFITAFTEVVRSGPLKESINLQQAIFAANQLVEQTPEGEPIDLNPLYEMIVEADNPKEITQQTFMALVNKSREVGILIREPEDIARMDDSARTTLLRRYSKQRQTGNYQRPDTQSNPTPGQKAENPNKRGGGKQKPNRVLTYALGVVIAGLAGSVVFSVATKEPVLEPMQITAARGLQCTEIWGNKPVVICKMPRKNFDKVDADIQEARAKITLKAAGPAFTRLHVVTLKDQPIRSYFQ